MKGLRYVIGGLQNEDAEELMRQVEQEEDAAAAADPEALQLHLCIINLVIGTLYCSKVRHSCARSLLMILGSVRRVDWITISR